MTNKEKYQRTFSVLHASDDCLEGFETMKRTHGTYRRKLAVIGAAAILVLALGSIAYANDVGGIQRNVQIWLRGDQTDAVMTVEDGEYTLTYTDENGESHERGGGGIAIDIFGRERPLTAEELLEEMNSPEAEYRDDGSVWLYYMDQKLEITDKFDEDGFCYVTVMEGDHPLYVTVKYRDGMAASSSRYVTPEDFAG